MTRIGRRLIEDFLLPALNEKKYGDLLKWTDFENRYFIIRWSHKNAAKWTLADTAVFQDWDRLKGHYKPERKGYYMQAKQRFRAALYKLAAVKKIDCDDKHIKKYQLLTDLEKKKVELLARAAKGKVPKKAENDNPSVNRPSVICKNSAYAGNQIPVCSSSAPPSSPESTKSDVSDDKEAMQLCIEEYTLAQKEQMNINSTMLKKENSSPIPMEIDSSDLKENSSQRTPHLPVAPAPVYNGLISVFENHQKRFESPQILLVKTYHEMNESTIKQEENDVGCVMNSFADPSNALNLSMRSDSDSSSR